MSSTGEIVLPAARNLGSNISPAEPLSYLHRTQQYQVIWFHGSPSSDDLLATVLPALDRRTYFIFSFSWFASQQQLRHIFELFAWVLSEHPQSHVVPDRILFLVNSREEWNAATVLDSPYQISLVNNNCFLDPQIYTIKPEIEKRFTAVYNAKMHAFKRHHLSRKVKSKVFITYDNDEPDRGITERVDLSPLSPEKIYQSISAEEVCAVLNSCHVGLLLSEEEGNCRASTEYLLCGLPVVSTESRGGRDEYYTSGNSVIVPPDPARVADAVDVLLRMLETGAIANRTIREGAIRRTQEFRDTFFSSLAKLVSSESDRHALVAKAQDLVCRHSQLSGYRNFYLTGELLAMPTNHRPGQDCGRPRGSSSAPTIIEAIYRHAAETPDKAAIAFENRVISYCFFAGAIDTLRRHLAAEGMAGDGIAVLPHRAPFDDWVLSLALRSLGVTTLVIPAANVIGELSLPGIHRVVTIGPPPPGFNDLCAARGWRLYCVPPEIYAVTPVQSPPDAGALEAPPGGHILLTSGTTGDYKMFLVNPANDTAFRGAYQESFGISGQSVVNLFNMRPWTGAGYRCPVTTWEAGGSMVYCDRPNQWEAFRYPGITHAWVTPLLLSQILNAPTEQLQRSEAMRLFVVAGPLSHTMWQLTGERLTSRIFTYVGSTEAANYTLTAIDAPEDLGWHRILAWREVQVVDEQDRAVPAGEVGQIRVRLLAGDGGYLDDPEASRRFFRNGYFYTGDLGTIRADGRLGLRGRVTEIVNILGVKKASAPIEEALQQRLEVPGICLFSVPTPGMEEEIHLAIEATAPIDRARLAAALDSALPNRSTVVVHYVPAMPRGDLGKIRRDTLKHMVAKSEAGIAMARTEQPEAQPAPPASLDADQALHSPTNRSSPSREHHPVESLNHLHRTNEYQITWFEGRSHDLFPALLHRLDRRTYLIWTSTWFESRDRLAQLFKHWSEALSEIPQPHLIPERILFLTNSREEWNSAVSLNSPYQISFVNHNCLLDPQIYRIQPEIKKRFAAVYNARAHAFKRHYLSQNIKDKIFITYDNNEPDSGVSKRVDLSALSPQKIFENISNREVSSILNSCHVGLILSEEEGGSYASTEYLLCGLPVVSTASRGGRDEYYTQDNSLIVPPDPARVAEATEQLIGMIRSKAIDSRAIRNSAIRRTQEFRETFFASLGRLVSGEPDAAALVAKARDLVDRHSKLRDHRNFFLTGSSLENATGPGTRHGSDKPVPDTKPTIVGRFDRKAPETADRRETIRIHGIRSATPITEALQRDEPRIAAGRVDRSALERKSETVMRLLIYGMQSSGASTFCYFLGQRAGSVAIIDLLLHCLAPSLKFSAPAVVKATANSVYRPADHIVSFRPDRTVLFLRDPVAVYAGLIDKPYGNHYGSVDDKIVQFDEDFAPKNWDLVVRYEDFIAHSPELIGSISEIGWPCTPEYYDLTRSFQEIADFNAAASNWLRSGFGNTWGFGNISPGPIRRAFTRERYPQRIREKVAELSPRLTSYYESLRQAADPGASR
jgi:non-ribosomal peptide synthetase component E (peptide arylation enzyme)/glycosyltransferase involved in cell wall biosynthesis